MRVLILFKFIHSVKIHANSDGRILDDYHENPDLFLRLVRDVLDQLNDPADG